MSELDSGTRWASNILVELLSRWGGRMSQERREALRRAVSALAEFQSAPRGENE